MADLSPELAAKIQTLEGGYADNPGRYFVALAGAWREAGEIGRAEEILRENLKRFPGLSAHVLLGRCLADRGAFQEAANEFHYVLSIDAQNLIALRTLAEMSAANGRRAEAERWYNELLAVDPMNAEARAALAELARGAADASVGDQPVQVGSSWGGAGEPAPVAGGADAGGAEADAFGMIDLSDPDSSSADASGVAAEDEGEWGDLPLDLGGEPSPAPASTPAGDFDAFGFGSVDLDGSAGGDDPWLSADARQDLGESAAAGRGAFPEDEDDTLLNAPVAGTDLPFLDADDTVPADLPLLDAGTAPGGFDAPAHADTGFGGFTAIPADDAASLPDFTAVPTDASAGLPPLDHGDDLPVDHDVDAEVVTETMAELYAAQGLLQQSADTYRELIRQRGQEPGLVRRLAEIEARLHPSDAAPAQAPAPDAADEAPDWLASVDAFAMGGAAASMAAIQMSTDEPEPVADLEPIMDLEPVADFEPVTEPGDDAIIPTEPVGDPLDAAGPSVDVFDDVVIPAGAGTDADAFADSFRGGFDGAEAPAPEPAFAAAPLLPGDDAAAGDREPWEAPAVRETEPVGFDLIVVEEDGDQVPAPPEVVADVSADWAIAAAPLEDDEEAAEQAAAFTPAGASTMRTYFAGLLAWQPGQPAAASTAVEEPAFAPPPAAVETAPAPAGTEEEEWAETPAPPAPQVADDEPWGAAPAAPRAAEEPWGAAQTDEEPWAEVPAAPAAEAPAHDLPAAAAPEPADEPWALPHADAPAPAASAGDDDLPLMDLEDAPWAAPREQEPPRIDAFTLADEAGAPAPSPAPAQEPAAPASAAADADEALPWELPPQPAAPAADAAADAGGFSFDDFFGGPSAPAQTPVLPEPEPEPAREPEPPAFVPSLAFEPAPAPAPAPAAAPAPPAAAAPAGGQEEDDEDLESFQAWLQSLKR